MRNMKDEMLMVLQFADSKVPEMKEVRSQGIVRYGEKNEYPEYLLYLYNKSSKHNAIVNGKVNYIFGKGLAWEGDTKGRQWMASVNRYKESLDEVINKCAIDVELFGGFYLQVIWSKTGTIADLYHIPFQYIRKGIDGDYLYKKDWTQPRVEAVPYKPLSVKPDERKGAQIFEYKEYRPGCDVYPLPGYLGSINYIETDIEISKYHLSAIRNGMFPSKMINLFNGEPSPEGKRKITRSFEQRFSGAENAGRFILNFLTDPSRAPQIQDLSATDLDKQFTVLNETVQQEIFAGHGITSPALFGIATPGKLGENNNLKESYDIFRNTYADLKQTKLEDAVNFLASLHGLVGTFKLQPVDPIGFNLSEAGLLQVAPKEWLLEKLNIDPNKYAQPVQQPAAMGKEYTEQEVADLFETVGESREEFVVIDGWEAERDSELKFYQSFAEAVSVTEANIIDLIRKDKRISPAVIADTLKVSREWVARKLADMVARGVIEQSSMQVGGDTIVERKPVGTVADLTEEYKPTTTEVFIRYSYEAKPGVGPAIKPTTRPFCRKLVQLHQQGRIYSRADIEQITQRVGYSVFDRAGGFWNMGNGIISPSCRHFWKTNIVIKKKRYLS